jgi:hypothetical protein
MAPHGYRGRSPWEELHDLGRTPDLGPGSRRCVEKHLLHRGMVEVQGAHTRRGRRNQVAPLNAVRAGADVPPPRGPTTRVQERFQDANPLGLDGPPRVHPFAPHPVSKLPLALDDEDAGALLGHGPAE